MGVYEWRAGEDRLIWSPGLLDLYGLTDAPDDEPGFSLLVHPDDRVRVEAETAGFLGGDVTSYSHTFRIVRPDGAVRLVLDRGVIERDADGRVSVLRGMNVDLTDLPRIPADPLSDAESIDDGGQLFAELETLYAKAPLGLALLDRELRFVRINPALSEINGFSVEEHLGRRAWDLVPGLRESAETPMRRVIETGLPLLDVTIRGETPARPGVLREWREHFYPVRGGDGTVTSIAVICEEVTERIAAKRTLASKSERLSIVQGAAQLGIYDYDVVNGTIDWDEQARALRGVGPQETITYALFMDTVHPDDRAATQAAVSGALDPSGTGAYSAEYRSVNRRDGAVRWIAATGQAVFNAGRAVRLIGAVQDITERKRAEAALRAAHDTFRQLVDRSPFGLYAIDSDFRLVQVSDGAQKVFENVRPLIGRDFAEVLRVIWPEPFASEAIGRFRRTLETGEPYQAPSTVERRADTKETESYDWKIERITMPDGGYGVVCHFYDLTERQAQEEKIRYLMREVNHRAKNMLALVEAVARQTASRTAEDFIKRFSERIRALAAGQDLLIQTDWEEADLTALLKSQLLHFKDLMGWRIMLDGPPVKVSARATQTLGMALHELSTNASKYGALSNDSGRVEISWKCEAKDGVAQFQMFWKEQGGPPVAAPERAGFGQQVAKSMVEAAMAAKVTLDYPRSGFTWTLRCPLSAISATA